MDWILHWFEPRVANDRGFRTWAPTTKSWCWASAQVTMIIFLKPMHFIVKQNFYWGLKITSKRAILNVEKCQRLHGCGEWRHWDVEKSGHQGRIVITKFEPLSLFVAIRKKVSVLFWYLSKFWKFPHQSHLEPIHPQSLGTDLQSRAIFSSIITIQKTSWLNE